MGRFGSAWAAHCHYRTVNGAICSNKQNRRAAVHWQSLSRSGESGSRCLTWSWELPFIDGIPLNTAAASNVDFLAPQPAHITDGVS